MIDRLIFANNVRRVMYEKDIICADICRSTGLCKSVVSRIVTGKSVPRIDTAIKIADALRVNLDELVK